MLFVGTQTGVFRIPENPFEKAERVLEGVRVRQLDTGEGCIYAATDSGVLRTTDGGESWTNLDTPLLDAHSVYCHNNRVYVGFQPARIYYADESQQSWKTMTGFESVAEESSWPTSPEHADASVRDIVVTGEVVLVGVEVGGLIVSTDAGSSFKKIEDVPDDVHSVLVNTEDHWTISCGVGGPDRRGGLFETTTAGKDWVRRDLGPYNYIRESCYTDRLYAAGNREAPLWNPPDAALFEEVGGELSRRNYPGEPESYIISWETGTDYIFAGTNDGLILRGPEEWTRLGRVPVSADEQRAWGARSLTQTSE